MAKKHVTAFLLFVLLAVVMTWPLARVLDRAVAYPGDPYINTWILDWDWHATFHQPLSLFQANAFYPSRDSLAYSENLYGIAFLLFPLRAAGVSPIAAHNIAILGGFALSGFAMYLLGFLITGNAPASMAAGVFYAFVPFRFTHLTHVQHVWGATLPLLLFALLWYDRKPTWRRAVLFGAAFLFNGLCNIHWLLFGSVGVAITWLIIRPKTLPLTVSTVVAAIGLILFLHPYFEVERLYGMHRSWTETMNYSARASDWLVSNFRDRLYARLRNPNVDPERWLFPGVLSIAIGCIGLWTRQWKPMAIAFAWMAIGFLGSLGLHTFFHRFLFSHVPGFDAIRVPARWASIAYVGLAMLVALGVSVIARKGAWAGALVVIAFVAELWSAPILWYMCVPGVSPVERWVAEAKPHAIAELPMNHDADYSVMLRATLHHRPIINGVSGFSPPESIRLSRLANEESDEFFAELRRIGVSHVIVHADGLDQRSRAWLSRAIDHSDLGLLRRFDGGVFGDWVFAVGTHHPMTPELAQMLHGDPTFSEASFGVLQFPQPGETLTSRAFVSAFAFSPYGLQEVNVLVNNGSVRLRTELRTDQELTLQFPWYDATTRPRFVAGFSKRPPGVWRSTDMQPEIIDGRGHRTLLEDRFINWP